MKYPQFCRAAGLALCAVLACMPTWAAEEAREMDSPLLQFGVAEYQVTRGEGSLEAELFATDGALVGKVTLGSDAPGLQAIELLRADGGSLRLEKNARDGSFTFTDASGLSGTMMAADGEFVSVGPAEEIWKENRAAFRLMAILASDLADDLTALVEPVSAFDFTAEASGLEANAEAYSCTPNHTHRGWAVHWSKQICCSNAALDANNQCNNGACFGCCHMMSCDAFCVDDTYLCTCGRTGWECWQY